MWVAVFVLLALRLSAFVLLVLRSACPLCLLSDRKINRIDLFSKAFSGASHFLKGTFQGPEVDELAMVILVQANNDRHKYMNLHTAMTERVVNLNSECA